jgi:hypothetical protein
VWHIIPRSCSTPSFPAALTYYWHMTRDGAKQASADTEIFEEDKDQLSRPRQRRPHRQRVGASSRRTVSTPPPRPPSPPSRHRLSKPEPTPEGHLLQGEVGPIPAAKTMNGVARAQALCGFTFFFANFGPNSEHLHRAGARRSSRRG